MNDKLKVWCREDANLEACPSFSPMTQTDIDNYLNNGDVYKRQEQYVAMKVYHSDAQFLVHMLGDVAVQHGSP